MSKMPGTFASEDRERADQRVLGHAPDHPSRRLPMTSIHGKGTRRSFDKVDDATVETGFSPANRATG